MIDRKLQVNDVCQLQNGLHIHVLDMVADVAGDHVKALVYDPESGHCYGTLVYRCNGYIPKDDGPGSVNPELDVKQIIKKVI